jgi:transketolase
MMEGISGEAASLAGHLGLGNLCWIYDNNHITIEGNTALAYSDDVATRFIGYGWNVTRVGDANDLDMLERALRTFKRTSGRPTLIIVDSHIAYGAPHKQDTSAAHGEPLGADEIRLTKRRYGWPEDAKFLVPDGVREHFDAGIGARGTALHRDWWALFERYRIEYPELAELGYRMLRRELPDGWDRGLPSFSADAKGMATRDASGQVLNAIARNVPWLLGGSADLGPSCKTRLTFDGAGDLGAENPGGRNLHFGIREHAMGAIVNGIAYHGAFRPYGSTFLVFSDYMRGAIRVAALSKLPVIFVFTHDSIFVGEDGPTHEPIEQVAALRLIPNLDVWRPADGGETALAWGMALERTDRPSAIVLTRQKLPPIERPLRIGERELRRGGYLVAGDASPHAIVAATGSELHLAVAARDALAARGVKLNVVSIPCVEVLNEQDAAYRDALFPEGVPVATVEAGLTDPWRALTGASGLAIGIDHFGASAPGPVNGEKFGFTASAVTAKIEAWIDEADR